VNSVFDAIALDFAIDVSVRNFDGFPFAAAVESVLQKYFVMFNNSVIDESSSSVPVLPNHPALRLHKLPLSDLRAQTELFSSHSRHGLEQLMFLSRWNNKADKSIEAYLMLAKGANLADFVFETTTLVKNYASVTDKILIEFFRSRGSGEKEYKCDSIPAHKLHSLFVLFMLSIRRARAQILGFKTACCALEHSMLERLILFRRISTAVSVFVKDSQAFNALGVTDLGVHPKHLFTLRVDPATGVVSVFSGSRAVVFPEALQQLDDIDAFLVKVCQIICANPKSQPLLRLHVMHDVWCAQAAFEEARYSLLRSMHELLMRCSTLVAVEQTVKNMNATLIMQSHWDLNCEDHSHPVLPVVLQSQAMILRSQAIDSTLVAQVTVERSLTCEFASVLGASIDDLDAEVYLQRMAGLSLSCAQLSSRSSTLAPGHMSSADIGAGNAACRIFQVFSILDDAVDCICDLRHITSSCMEFAVAMEASQFALDAIRRVHAAHDLQQLPTIQHASMVTCSVKLLELCENPALISFVCKSTGHRESDGFISGLRAAFECLRLRESLLDASYRSSVLRCVYKNLLDASGVAECVKAEKVSFTTKPRKDREPPAIKPPTIELAVSNSKPLSICSNPLCCKLVDASFQSLEGLRTLVSEQGQNRSMQTLRMSLVYELSEAYVLEALVSHSQLAVDVAWRNTACKALSLKSRGSSSDNVRLPCNWAGGGLRGVLPVDAATEAATALYSRERIYFNALATMTYDPPSCHDQAFSVISSFCTALVSEAELPLLIAQNALQTNRLAMKLARLPQKCCPIVAPFVEPRIKGSTVHSAQTENRRQTFSSHGDLVDLFYLPSISQWLRPVCNSASIMNLYLCAIMTLSDLLSLVHVRGVIVSENSVGDAMVGFFHKISTELSERITKSSVADMTRWLQVRCHSWFVKHTILLKSAREIMLNNEDYKNARRIQTAICVVERSSLILGETDAINDDDGGQCVVEHMYSRPSLGFLDECFVLMPFAERSMLGNECSKIDFAVTAHLTSLVKSVNATEIALQEFDYLRLQLSAIDVKDGLVSLKTGRSRPETKQQLKESTEIIESYVRQQLGVQMSDLGPEDFVVKLVSRTNVLLLRKYLLEIGSIYDKVSQFEAEMQAVSAHQSQRGDESENDLQKSCAALLSCLECDDIRDRVPGTKIVLVSQLNQVLGDFASVLCEQSSCMSQCNALLASLAEIRADTQKLLTDQRVEQITLNEISDRFSRLYFCRIVDTACSHLYKERAYTKQLHHVHSTIGTKTRAAQSQVHSVFDHVVCELDTQNRTRRADLFKDCKTAMVSFSKTMSACFREASVVALNCHLPEQRLIRKPPTSFPNQTATQASSQVVYYSERLHPLEYPSLIKLLVEENSRMTETLVCTRAFFWWKRLVATSQSSASIRRDNEEKDKITKDRFGTGALVVSVFCCVTFFVRNDSPRAGDAQND
jgi:hypothetical protein